jgi:hypothetical protein
MDVLFDLQTMFLLLPEGLTFGVRRHQIFQKFEQLLSRAAGGSRLSDS